MCESGKVCDPSKHGYRTLANPMFASLVLNAKVEEKAEVVEEATAEEQPVSVREEVEVVDSGEGEERSVEEQIADVVAKARNGKEKGVWTGQLVYELFQIVGWTGDPEWFAENWDKRVKVDDKVPFVCDKGHPQHKIELKQFLRGNRCKRCVTEARKKKVEVEIVEDYKLSESARKKIPQKFIAGIESVVTEARDGKKLARWTPLLAEKLAKARGWSVCPKWWDENKDREKISSTEKIGFICERGHDTPLSINSLVWGTGCKKCLEEDRNSNPNKRERKPVSPEIQALKDEALAFGDGKRVGKWTVGLVVQLARELNLEP